MISYPQLRHLLPTALAILFIALALHPALTPLLRWQRDALAHGEWYRLLSAHFVHANLRHAAANALALLTIWVLFESAVTLWVWVLSILLCALAISALLFATDVAWYVGFSGVLHGMLVLALCRDRRLQIALRAVLLGAVAAKIGAERLLGTDSGHWFHIVVISQAHLFGALTGAAIAAVLTMIDRLTAARSAIDQNTQHT